VLEKSVLLFLALMLSACATQTTVTGRVVDVHRRPVRGGVVRAYWSHPLSSHDPNAFVDRVALEQHSLDANGQFSFTAPSKPDRFEAETGTVAHWKFGELKVVSLTDNVIVVR
jgi:hypothetical protein